MLRALKGDLTVVSGLLVKVPKESMVCARAKGIEKIPAANSIRHIDV
jgi:hypothetical protein